MKARIWLLVAVVVWVTGAVALADELRPYAPCPAGKTCKVELHTGARVAGSELLDALRNAEGPWWSRLRRCDGRAPNECSGHIALLGCATAFGQFVVSSSADGYGRATVEVVHRDLARLATCLGVDRSELVVRLAPQQGEIPSALPSVDAELLATGSGPGSGAFVPGAAYSIYVGRAPTLLYATTVVIPQGETDLQRLLGHRTAPWLAATWSSGSLQFAISEGSLSEATIAELRLAAEQGRAWFQSLEKHWPIEVTEDGDALTLPGTLFHALKQERWGRSGDVLTPTSDEWRELLGAVEICLPRSYRRPDGALCVRLMDVMAMEIRPSVGLMVSSNPRDVLKNRRVDGQKRSTHHGLTVVTPWDGVQIVDLDRNKSPGLRKWCQADCDLSYDTRRRGLIEYRVTAKPTDQGLTLARVWIIDPRMDWLPGNGTRWDLQEADVRGLAFRRQRTALATTLTIPAEVEAVWGHRLPHTLPIAPSEHGDAPVFTVTTTSESCPRAAKDGAVNRGVVDQRFFVHLVANDVAGLRCLARASYSIWEARSRSSRSLARTVLFGDQLLTFSAEERSVALMLPIASVFSPRVGNARLEISTGLAGMRRLGDDVIAGAASWVGVQFGPEAAPRIFTVGASLLITLSGERILGSYIGLNLGTLYDLAGGR